MYTLKTWHAQDSHLLFFHPFDLWPSPSLDFPADLARRNSRRWLQIEHLIQTAIMVKYNLLQPAIVGAAVLGLIAAAFGVPAQAGKISISIIATLHLCLSLMPDRPSGRETPAPSLGAAHDRHRNYHGAVVHKHTNEDHHQGTQGQKSVGGMRFTAINRTPEPCGFRPRRNWGACNIQSPRS